MRDRKFIKRPKRKKKNRIKLCLFAILFVWIFYILVGHQYGLVKIISFRLEEKRLNREILELKTTREILERECERLEKDIFLVEKIAREKFGMIKEGEKCYRFVD